MVRVRDRVRGRGEIRNGRVRDKVMVLIVYDIGVKVRLRAKVGFRLRVGLGLRVRLKVRNIICIGRY